MSQVHLCFLLVLLTAATGVTAQSGKSAGPDVRPFRLVVIGSSTAAGAGARPVDSAWVNRYERYLKSIYPANQVINLAKRGYQSYHLMPNGFKTPANRPAPDTLRNITRALSLLPDAILITLPSNDVASGNTIQELLANFEVLTNAARELGIPIWVSTTQPRNFGQDKIKMQRELRDSILSRYPDRSIDFWKGLAGSDGRLQKRFNAGDGIHINNAGHHLLYEYVRTNNLSEMVLTRQRQLYLTDKVWSQTIPLNLHTFRPPPPKPQTVVRRVGTMLLRADQPREGVTVEIFNSAGKRVRQGVYDLPTIIKTDFGPKGVYWIRMQHAAFFQMKKWIKTE